MARILTDRALRMGDLRSCRQGKVQSPFIAVHPDKRCRADMSLESRRIEFDCREWRAVDNGTALRPGDHQLILVNGGETAVLLQAGHKRSTGGVSND